MTLVTPQTGPDGRRVKTVLVEEQVEPQRELYLGVVIDSGSARPVMMASSAGGMEIEEVAARSPELIHKVAIDPASGLHALSGATARLRPRPDGRPAATGRRR